MKDLVGAWVRVGIRNRRRFHFIESQISDRAVTFCGRTLDSTRDEPYVFLEEMADRGVRCLTCERRQARPVPPMPDQPTV